MKSGPSPVAAVGRLVAARALADLARTVSEHRAVAVTGLWGSSVAAVTAALSRHLARPVLLVCGHIDEADDLADDVELFAGTRPEVVPALELSGTLGHASEEQASNRLQMVSRWAGEGSGFRVQGSEGKASKLNPELRTLNPLFVASIQSLMQSVPSRQQIAQLVRTLRTGQELESEKLIVWLSERGYQRLDQIEVPGDFAVRGGIVDIYIPGDHEESTEQVGLAVRIDFFGDTIESIKTFDLDTLGSRKSLASVDLLDIRGQLPETGESTSVLSYLPEDTIVILWAPLEIAEQAKSYFDRLPEIKGIYPLGAVLKLAERFTRVEMATFGQSVSALGEEVEGKRVPEVRLPIRSLQKFETESKKALVELAELAESHDVCLLCENDGERNRFAELIAADIPGAAARIQLGVGYLHRGFVWESDEATKRRSDEGEEGTKARRHGGTEGATPSIGNRQSQIGNPLALLGHHELFHRYEMRRRVKKMIASRPVDSFLDLKVGDYVVHVAHGIAKFVGMQTVEKDGKTEEYLTLRFAEGASLHVPASRINLIQKYVGGFQGTPKLSRLGSGTWEKEKAKVSEAVMDMASDLLEVQAARAAELGVAFPADSDWQREFEAEFPYEPTVDQVTGAEDIKQDMQKPRPMDRLLCGDVGYGKTELAMRAAFKAVEHGKQVAVLVPTTVLAEQHYRSFRERMVNYPFNVESLSRIKSSREQKDILDRCKRGEVDILIGTHRLLSKDVNFGDLGLVVVDEEQRFGVTHKERLKQMRKTVDVLTMSATPIPRTLHMSMLGLRDISNLTTAPQDRRSVVTEVMQYDKERIKLAIERELNREGQIYFVHNRIYNIFDLAAEIQQMVPTARILVAHGQMDGTEMEEAMLKFVRHEADILVSTTIIESGLDIPNANTIFIDNADRFGLSELHQLRGRVGRWKHRAYCYLLLPQDRPVTPTAAKRLKAIEEYSHLGAGFKIAMKDLEIRGAGNILGPEQSGHIATVGYEMYCQLLEEATLQLKNEPRPLRPDAHVEIGLTAYIPKTYLSSDRQRMDAYRRLTRCSSVEMVKELADDLKDAFGEPPREFQLLVALTELRLLAGHYGVDSILRQHPDCILSLRDAQRVQQALVGAPGTLRIVDEKTLYFRPPASYMESEVLLMVLRNLMHAAYEREKRGEPAPIPKAAPAPATPPARKDDDGVKRHEGTEARRHEGRKSDEAAKRRSDGGAKRPQAQAVDESIAAQLERLASLRKQGYLSEQEFLAAKQRIIEGK